LPTIPPFGDVFPHRPLAEWISISASHHRLPPTFRSSLSSAHTRLPRRQDIGLAPGSVTGVVSPNHCDFYAAVAGSLRAGLGVTPVNPTCSPKEIAMQLTKSDTRLVFAHADLLAPVEEAAKLAGCVRDVVVLGDQQHGGRESLRGLVRATNGRAPAAVNVELDDLALLPFSSGTTGEVVGAGVVVVGWWCCWWWVVVVVVMGGGGGGGGGDG
jgi:acyl-coenzyme A synthetase/AMP-(fatty) acid ligase